MIFQSSHPQVALPKGAAQATRRHVLLFPGLIPFLQMTGEGNSAKGELVQWSDLISALTRLGHKVTVVISAAAFEQALQAATPPDRIFTDYVGVTHFVRRGANVVSRFLEQHKCRFRILDIYGTYPRFNEAVTPPAGSGVSTEFCCLRLPSARQYLTWIPPTLPDPVNTFLGFTVPIRQDIVETTRKVAGRAYVWGKENKYWRAAGVEAFLQEFVQAGYELHGTASGSLPPALHAINHGALGHEAYLQLLASAELIIGLGDPVIGPTPIEAMAYGCVYVNIKYVPARALFGKPSDYRYTSQVPLLEQVPEPLVYSVDPHDAIQVRAAIAKIKSHGTLARPYFMHPDFTRQALLARVHQQLMEENFCAH